MTNARMKVTPIQLPMCNVESSKIEFLVEGHAGFAEKGNDIVCAAESILVQTLAVCLAKCEEDYLYEFTLDGVAGSGCVHIVAVPTQKGWDHVMGLFESAATGFYLLSEAYPEHVDFKLKTPYQEKETTDAK